MMVTFRDECQQSMVSPGGVTLKQRDGSLAPLVGGAYFLCAYGSYEIAMVGGRRYTIKSFSGFDMRESG
jgi:hypothetical protein